MSVTTHTQRPNPFAILDVVIVDTRAREAVEAANALQRAEDEKAARQKRVDEDRAAEAALEIQIANERAAKAAQDEENRRQAAFNNRILDFQERFSHAIAKSEWFKNLKSTAQQAAGRYCEALASSDMVLPSLDPSMASVIHDKFAYGIMLAGDRIPENHFVGQRQDWFLELLEKKQGIGKSEKITYTQPAATSSPAPKQSAPATKPVLDLPPATTQRSKRPRGAQRKG